ncbi:Predicted RNA-binding protein, contains PUA-like domain [Rhodoblastus acidophilus]|uniref:Predicted RNA-binding protein, contains PUA-like domain n=1 Tax=Rhodoblastus acidophilus TaxID=1074 RepID=A0A212RM74_RHOAC|nr:EVE domain-containing protein [Rhodoblastus acidophilus]MCW2315757.1 putative RNA-binding protein with PUA-like domain [Rhodoblastus acidophilus]PPQ39155.1 EVE domain-containing protein [Rhodoblastus acidophilus]RAI21043.1 EVE domain-containing protein [Rhodoblastus acidophilus]SNB73638.1 Predicted RNA-binding protein, contains PUA-like domain [Rhodoblastus acidophilus]
MSAFWLFKSEPDAWSWDQMVACGAAGTGWTGVRNHLAKKQMQAMQAGDLGFFYHSNVGKAVVGVVEVIKTFHPDPTDESGKFGMVDVRAVEPLPRPVTLEEIKADARFADMALVTNMRLSVQPVSAEHWNAIRALGGL